MSFFEPNERYKIPTIKPSSMGALNAGDVEKLAFLDHYRV